MEELRIAASVIGNGFLTVAFCEVLAGSNATIRIMDYGLTDFLLCKKKRKQK